MEFQEWTSFLIMETARAFGIPASYLGENNLKDNIMSKLEMCEGVDCKIKETCKRYSKKKESDIRGFIIPAIRKGNCLLFIKI